MPSRSRGKTSDQLAAGDRGRRRLSSPGSLHFVPFDLGDVDEIPDLVQALRKEFGPIYGLVNNAALDRRLARPDAQFADRAALSA